MRTMNDLRGPFPASINFGLYRVQCGQPGVVLSTLDTSALLDACRVISNRLHGIHHPRRGRASVTSTGSVRSLSSAEACPEPSRRACAELSRSGLALPNQGPDPKEGAEQAAPLRCGCRNDKPRCHPHHFRKSLNYTAFFEITTQHLGQKLLPNLFELSILVTRLIGGCSGRGVRSRRPRAREKLR